jgi:hypothetical protein
VTDVSAVIARAYAFGRPARRSTSSIRPLRSGADRQAIGQSP